jgi:hypothetical protein
MGETIVTPLLVLAEFVFSADGEVEFQRHLDRTLHETRSTEGCLQAVLWKRPGRRYQFSTLWTDASAVTRWVENEFHRTVLMPGFRKWCTEGCFGEYLLEKDHKRARKCASCGRWTQALPGWDEARPETCEKCGAKLEVERG